MVEVLIGVVLLAIGGAGGWFARKLMEAAKRGARMPETAAARGTAWEAQLSTPYSAIPVRA